MTGAFLLQSLAPPGALTGALSIDALLAGQWWTPLTHLFVHAGWDHWLGNIVLLLLAGRSVQRLAGAQHFAYIFLLSGCAGAAAQLCVLPEIQLFGASAAVCGVLGAFCALDPEYSVTSSLGRFFPWRLRAKNLFAGMFLASVSLEILARVSGDRIPRIPALHDFGHLAHAAGLLTGWLYGRRLMAEDRALFLRGDFFPQGLRRRRQEEEKPALVRSAGPPHWQGPPPEETGDDHRPLSDAEFLRERVDPVLDKLHENGAASLTPDERAILAEAARRFRKR